MAVPFTFGSATAAIPLSQLDTNFATTITLGNTAIQLGNTVTTLNNMTLANVTISSGNVTLTNVSVANANVTTALTLSGGTANGVAYLNTSKVVTTGSALVFDGTNLGVGVTPSAWTDYKVIQIGAASSLFGDITGNETLISSNARYDNGFKYLATQAATNYRQLNGVHSWSNAASGTAGNAITFTQAMTLNASGNLGIGTTSPAFYQGSGLMISRSGFATLRLYDTAGTAAEIKYTDASGLWLEAVNAKPIIFSVDATERARIDSSGNLLVNTTSTSRAANGVRLIAGGSDDASVIATNARASGGAPIEVNRQVSDGVLIAFYQADVGEGNISVSGTTVSYNGGHLARYAQTVAAKDESLVKGTVLSNLDAMNVYTNAEGNPVDNEQLNKVKVSDVEGDVNVAGVFVNWSHDEDHNVDEVNMAMTGDMIIRIAQGTTVQRGDLLMSAGNGTAKPQNDDIVRSKTVAKVTSTHVTCTYEDGSYCVPCVLMAC
jgi:hypothetical protein